MDKAISSGTGISSDGGDARTRVQFLEHLYSDVMLFLFADRLCEMVDLPSVLAVGHLGS